MVYPCFNLHAIAFEAVCKLVFLKIDLETLDTYKEHTFVVLKPVRNLLE